MALALGTDRAAQRSRVHASGAPRPMVRATAGVRITAPPPRLEVVPRHRRTARLVVLAATVVFGLMLAAAAFQTQLARRQLTLDRLDRDIRTAHEQYSELRTQRAELRSPGRLATAATALGMQPASRTKFMTIAPDVVAEVQQSAGGVFDTGLDQAPSGFGQYSTVKSVAGGTP